MPDYKKMYFQLAAKVADAVQLLVQAQQLAEKEYIEGENPVVGLTQAERQEECPAEKAKA